MKRKRILVTGGAGFIGSHLCKRLLDDNNNVLCVDNFFTGSKDNILELMKNERFELLRHDITFPLYVEVDEIYNLACPASPTYYQLDPVQTIKTSVHGSINMLGLAKRTNAKILQASTSEVYGDPEVNPQKESYWGRVNPIGPRSCYDEGKRCAESLFFNYYKQHKIDIKIVRVFNTYGPSMASGDGRVVSNFITQALNNKDITVYGDGTQTRSFQYIDDLIEALLKVMNKDNFTGPVNIGNPQEISISKLATKILKMIPESKSKVVYKSLPIEDPKHRKPDITMAKKELKWEPKIKIEEGIEKTIEWFKNNTLE